MTCSFLAYFLLSQLHVADVLDSLSCWERISLAWIDDDNDDGDDDGDDDDGDDGDDNVDDDQGSTKLLHPAIPYGRIWSKLGEHGELG